MRHLGRFVLLTFDFFARREEFVEQVDARRTMGSELERHSCVVQASRGALASGLFVRHVRRRNEPLNRGAGYVKRSAVRIRRIKNPGADAQWHLF